MPKDRLLRPHKLRLQLLPNTMQSQVQICLSYFPLCDLSSSRHHRVFLRLYIHQDHIPLVKSFDIMIRTFPFKFCCLHRCNRLRFKTERRREKKENQKKMGKAKSSKIIQKNLWDRSAVELSFQSKFVHFSYVWVLCWCFCT